MDIGLLITTFRYPVLFIGMFLLGETVLLPAVYLAFEGKLDITKVILVSTLATIVSDLVWYFLAVFTSFQKVLRWKHVAKQEAKFEKLSLLFDRHSYRILFLSKFVYGTRILVQIICGMKKLNLAKYLVVNALGTLVYALFLALVAFLVDRTIANSFVSEIKFAFVGFLASIVFINICIHYLVQKSWFRS